MKKLFVILGIFIGTLFVYAQTPKELFLKANKEFTNGNYEKAIELYTAINEQDVESAEVYFNLGNCYYKLNKVAPSIYYYEKALKLNPEYDDAITNLAFAKLMTIDVIEQLPQTFFQKFANAIIHKLSFDTWAIVGTIFSFLVALTFLLYYFSTSSVKKLLYFNASILSGFIMVVSLFFAYQNYRYVQQTKEAIIFDASVEVKNAPTLQSDDVFELHEGTKVFVLDSLDTWKKIKLADGKIGWITASSLKEI